MAAKVHPDLLTQLDRAGSGLVQAVFQLQSPAESAASLSPQDAAELAKNAMDRAAKQVGHKATRSNLLKNLGTLIVEADPTYLRSLMEQPEIYSVIPNKMAESPLIPPKGKRPV